MLTRHREVIRRRASFLVREHIRMSGHIAFLSEDAKIVVEGPTATGTTVVDFSVLDMAYFAAVLFLCRLGTAAANNNIRARQDVASGGAFADVTGSLVSHATNNVLVLDLKRSDKRYVRLRVTRGTSTTIDFVAAIMYGARNKPSTQLTTTTFKQIVGALDGVA